MKPAMTMPLADDGKPRIDVVELATSIIGGGARAETMVSQREIRAMAGALHDFNTGLTLAARTVWLIGALGRPHDPATRIEAERVLAVLADFLARLGYLEERHAEAS
jgi:hypothetical protein